MKLKIQNRYGIVPNDILNNKELSFKAKGLFAYIQAKPDDWDFSSERISLETKDGVDSITAGLKELEKFGLLKREKYRNEKGHWLIEYILTDKIDMQEKQENPVLENPVLENPVQEKPGTNKEIVTKKYIQRNNNIISTKVDIETEVSGTELEIENKIEEPKEYGNKEINSTLLFLSKNVGCTTFLETQAMQRIYGKHILNLGKKIGKEEFYYRLKETLSDPFKQKNCNKLAYLYGELKSFIHSPLVKPKNKIVSDFIF